MGRQGKRRALSGGAGLPVVRCRRGSMEESKEGFLGRALLVMSTPSVDY